MSQSRRTSVLACLALIAGLLGAPAAAESAAHRDLQWGLGQVRAPAAWPTTVGTGTTIAVIDSGVDLDHPDLAGRLAGGATFIGCPGAADGCGEGGWRDGGQAFNGEDPNADGHGTHVAGIALASGIGTAGVAPGARLLSVKALRGSADPDDPGGGTTEEVAAGIRWAVRNGADVINLSLATPQGVQALGLVGALSPIKDALREAAEAGVVVVAAAGNDFIGICSEPAFDRRVVCVVATDRNENPASYSNLAIDDGFNVVAAPGGAGLGACELSVLSTWPTSESGPCRAELGTPGYAALSGTSMAAPHVAGVAALLIAQGRGAREAVGVLQRTARTPGGGRGTFTPEYGFGIVDAAEAAAQPVLGAVERLAGGNRLETAAAVSRRTVGDAHTVLVARADDYADALAGAPLAAHLRAPLLLSARSALSDPARQEIRRLGAERAVLLGGQAALSAQVTRDLEALGLEVDRIAGENRFDTAARIAGRLPNSGEAFVTEGANPDPSRGWPDALSASGLAAAERVPILLVTRDRLPAETAEALSSGTDVTIVGGTAAVSEAVERTIDERAGDVSRIAGATRYETSARVVAEADDRGVSADIAWIATGRAFADGLVGGAAAGTMGGLLYLVDGTDLDRSPATRDALDERAARIHTVRLVGGTAAISTATEQRLHALVR